MTCEACKTIPPVIATGHETKGSWIEMAGLKTYSTGSPSTSTRALITLYDAFGFAPQTFQGADALAQALGCLVVVPDFFEGQKAEEEWFLSSNPDHEEAKAKFMAFILDFAPFKARLEDVIRDGKEKFPGVEAWGAYGLCWGGKVVALNSGPGTLLKVSGQVHPGRLAVSDARAITIPHIVLASNGEDAAVVKEYAEVLVGEGKPGEVEYYGTMHHGWMGARAKLEDGENKKEFERGYNQLAAFFAKHL